MISSLTVLFSLTVFLNSCARLQNGPLQEVRITSQPRNATIFIDGEEVGKTPKTFFLKRNGRNKNVRKKRKGYDVKIILEGYEPYEIYIVRKVDGTFWGNLFIGGLIGISIDAATGSMYSLTPTDIYAQLYASMSKSSKVEEIIFCAVIMNPDPKWEKIGNLIKTTSE